MKTIETTAKTTEDAIEIALKELDAERPDVEIDVVSKGKSGILGIGGEPARVRVTVLEKPSDEVKPDWDLSGAFEDLIFMYAMGRQLADSEDWPEWSATSEFRAIREAQR